LVETKVAL